MASFGDSLRRERELRGTTLAELASATKISLRYLQALERDQFDRLPGGVFNRGFVRAMARYLGLDENHWVAEYARAADEELPPASRQAQASASPAAPGHRNLWSFAVLLLVFGLSALAIHLVRQQRAAEAAPSLATDPAGASLPLTEPAPSPAREAQQASVGAGLASGGKPESIKPATAATARELQLQVDVLEDAWMQVVIDGRPRYRGMMRPGESRRFRGRGRIELTTGNASAVVLTLNGETLAPLGNPGERKNIVLTAQDLSAASRP